MASFRPLALALFLVPACMAAQDSTAPEFHSGQWALQFGGNLDLATLGIMRFSGPRSALVLSFDLTGSFLKGTTTDPIGGSTGANDHNFFFQAGLGKRFYQSVRSKVRSFQTIGIIGGYVDQKSTFSATATTRNKSVFGGLRGEVGGAYWLASNLSIGGTASASAAYQNQEFSQSGGFSRKQHGFAFSGMDVALVLGIYF
jgi:hypothetical protein